MRGRERGWIKVIKEIWTTLCEGRKDRENERVWARRKVRRGVRGLWWVRGLGGGGGRGSAEEG